MKRQSSVVSSSSRRENAPEKIHAKTIGCMSGILHLLSNNSRSSRSRRFLTFGKKQTKDHSSSSSPATTDSGVALQQRENPKEEKVANVNAGHKPRLSCEVPRSPTLPAEIRRSNPVKPPPPPENRRDQPALMARLMGLEEAPAAPESVAEKRQKLLGALQKCDEDLKALKKIIDAVRSADPLPAPVVSRSACRFGDNIKTVSEVKCSAFKGEQQQQQQPSPVSVLDEFTRSPLSPSCPSGRHSFGRMQQQKQQLLKKPGEEEISSAYIYERKTSELAHAKCKDEDHSLVMWSSKAMVKSVEEVCRDIAWGEKRELGRIGLALQDCICKDLIEEIVRELGCFYPLPFEACKRRLCF